MLEGIACGDADREALEAWIAPDGRFRLGALAGAWTKPAAAHIGFAARAAARARRLAEIAERLKQLRDENAELEALVARQENDTRQAVKEWHEAPSG